MTSLGEQQASVNVVVGGIPGQLFPRADTDQTGQMQFGL